MKKDYSIVFSFVAFCLSIVTLILSVVLGREFQSVIYGLCIGILGINLGIDIERKIGDKKK